MDLARALSLIFLAFSNDAALIRCVNTCERYKNHAKDFVEDNLYRWDDFKDRVMKDYPLEKLQENTCIDKDPLRQSMAGGSRKSRRQITGGISPVPMF